MLAGKTYGRGIKLMENKNIFALVVGVVALIGMYLVSIGGFHLSPQKVTLITGQSRKVANGRATLYAGEISYKIEIGVSCKSEQTTLSMDLDAEFSEKVCGIQLKPVEIVEGKFGSPGVTLEVRW
jgi:hypothetical protein